MTMTQQQGLEAKLRALRQQAEQARAARANAEHQRAVAEATVTRVAEEISAEFGIKPEDALAVLAGLDAKAADEVALVERLLAAAEGQG